jgi:hypothetical protein
MAILWIIIFLVFVFIIYRLCLWIEGTAHNVNNFFTHGPRRWFLLIAIIVAVIIATLVVSQCSSSRDGKDYSQESRPSKKQRNREQTSQIFKFEEGCGFSVRLKAGWKCYPKGGEIKIITPSGEIYYNSPGEDLYIGYQPDSIYKFFPREETTTGVEIYNYW